LIGHVGRTVVSPRPRTSSLIATLALAGGLVGCGNNKSAGSASHATTSTSQPASSASLASPITPAAALAFAHAVNLHPGDLPGAVATNPERDAPPPSATGKEFARCAGAPDPGQRVVDVRSASFKIGSALSGGIRSSVEVMPSTRLALESFTAAESSRGRSCVSKLLPSLLGRTTRTGVSYSNVAITPISPPLKGARAFGYEIKVTVTAKRPGGKSAQLPFYVDVFEQLDGPAEVGMTDFAALHPPSSAIEGRVMRLLAARAKSHTI
jgi:hypothetical protein